MFPWFPHTADFCSVTENNSNQYLQETMYNKKPLLFAAILCMVASAGAQVSSGGNRYYNTLSTTTIEPRLVEVIDGVSTMHYELSTVSFNGSPYLSEEFTEGTMTILDGTVVPGLKYRYDIFGDKMQFIVNQDTATINKPLALRSLELGDRKFVYEVFLVESNRVATGYFEIIEESEYLTILFRREIELEQDVYVPNYGGGGGTKEFKMKENNSYFIKQGDAAALKINSKKDFLEMFSDHQEQLKQYIKEHRLSVKKGEDLQAIANYYGSLQGTGS